MDNISFNINESFDSIAFTLEGDEPITFNVVEQQEAVSFTIADTVGDAALINMPQDLVLLYNISKL